jgi:acylaminoacyl-peptidase
MYTQLAEIPVPTAAYFLNTTATDGNYGNFPFTELLTPSLGSGDQHGSSIVQVAYSVRDHVRNVKRAMIKSIVISSEGSVIASMPLQDQADIIAQVISPSRKLRAVLRNVKSGDSSPGTRLVEI